MEASTSDQTRAYSKPVLESHLDVLGCGTLPDVTFIVGPGKERIPCHQVLLAARSPVFEVMFSERWNQDNNKEIPLQDIDPKIFKKFLLFIYADTIVANVPEALELVQVAHKYDVQLLVSRCEKLLLANELLVKDAVDVFQAAQKYEMIQLVVKAGDLMAKSPSELQSLPSFLRMDKEALLFILKSKYLKMKEVDIFRLAVKWANNQPSLTVQQSLEDILPLIRFPIMTLEEFTRTVVPTGLLSQSTLVEIFTYFGADTETKKSMAGTLKFNTQSRRSIHSIHYVDLYSGNLARKNTKCVQLEKLEDCLQISTRFTGTRQMGIGGISVYCPNRVASRPFSASFKEFKIVFARRYIKGGSSYQNLVSMSPVKAEEGKMTEIIFDTVVPLENNAHFRITVEEIRPRTQLAGSREDYYVVKLFDHRRQFCLTVNVINLSLVIQGDGQESFGEDYVHTHLISRLGLEEL